MDLRDFEEVVDQAVAELPEEFRARIANIEILIEEAPDRETRRRFPGLLLGLYRGVPLTERSVLAPPAPDLIFLYKKNLERISRGDLDELRRQIVLTIRHELGHYFGLDEEDLEDV